MHWTVLSLYCTSNAQAQLAQSAIHGHDGELEGFLPRTIIADSIEVKPECTVIVKPPGIPAELLSARTKLHGWLTEAGFVTNISLHDAHFHIRPSRSLCDHSTDLDAQYAMMPQTFLRGNDVVPNHVSGCSASASAQPVTPGSFGKTVLCKFHYAPGTGPCDRGNECNSAHSVLQQQQARHYEEVLRVRLCGAIADFVEPESIGLHKDFRM